jgi:hypothetical protein
VTAHEDYERVSESAYLGKAQKREALDGICVAEEQIGKPLYSAETQYQDCLNASKQPGSTTGGPTLSRLEIQLKAEYGKSINAAIAAQDDSQAQALIEKYKTLTPTDTKQISEWEQQLQRISDAREALDAQRATAQARAEEQIRRSAKVSFCVALVSAFEYESTYGVGNTYRAAGMNEEAVKKVLWQKAMIDVSNEDVTSLTQDLASANSVQLQTAFLDVEEVWRTIAQMSFQQGNLTTYCSN